MHYVYIIYSPQNDKYYVGETINVTERVKQHNSGYYKSGSTRFTNDWEARKCFATEDRKGALKVEGFIKSMKSKKFIEKLLSDEEFLKGFKQIVLERFGVVAT